jgi:tetratricopeptide (TPR) repeat protein
MRTSILYAWGQTLLFFGRSAAALRVFEQVVGEDPSRDEAWSVIGFLQAQRGAISEAVPAFDKALALRPHDVALCFNAAFVLQKAGAHERAIPLLRHAIELDPKMDRAWYGLGLSFAHGGRYEEAIIQFRQAARLQPFNPYAGYQLAAAFFKLGRRDELQQEYERIKQFDPKVSAIMRADFGIHDSDFSR